MTFSKILPRIALFTFALITAAGCSRSPRQPKDTEGSENASFVASAVSLESVQTVDSLADLNVPKSKAFQMKACLQDVAYLTPMNGQAFSLDGVELKADAAGCLHWTEQLNFDYFESEKYFRVVRRLSGISPQRGILELPLAINPWSEGDDAVLDERFASATKASPTGAQSALTERRRGHLTYVTSVATKPAGSAAGVAPSAQATGRAFLAVSEIEYYFFQSENQGKLTKLPFRMRLQPSAVRTKLDGSGASVALPIGKFRLHLDLIERRPQGPGKTPQAILIASKTFDAAAVKGMILLESDLELLAIPAQRSTFELRYALETHPDSGARLESDQGKIAFDSIYGSGETSVDHQKLVAIEEPSGVHEKKLGTKGELSELVLNDGSRKKMGMVDSTPSSNAAGAPPDPNAPASDCGDKDYSGGLVFDTVEINHAGFSGVASAQRTSNEIQVNLKACVKSSIDWHPVTRAKFRVGLAEHKDDAVTIERETDLSGCMRWNERIKFDYTQPERWLSLFVRVASQEAPYKDVQKALKVYINPWQVGWLHAWDCRSGSPPSGASDTISGDSSVKSSASVRARVGIVEVYLNFNGREFDLNSALKLKMDRKYRVQFRPLIVRHDLGDPTVAYKSAGDGKFHLRLALLRNVTDAGTADAKDRFISGWEGDVEAKNGVVVQEVPFNFEFREFPWVVSRNELVMELSSVEEGSGLEASTWTSPVQIGDDATTSTLVPSDLDLAKLLEEGARAKAQASEQALNENQALQKDRVLQDFVGLSRVTKEESQKLGLSLNSFSQMAAGNHGELGKACGLFFGREKIEPVGVIQKVKSFFTGKASALDACRESPESFLFARTAKWVEKILGKPVEKRADAYMLSVNSMFSRAGSVATYAGGSVGLSLSTPLKIGPSADLETYVGTRVDQSKTYSQNTMLIRSLNVEQIDLAFDAEARTCVVVGRKDKGADSPHKFVCLSEAAQRENLQESWYYLSQLPSFSSTFIRDPRMMNERSWFKLMRGAGQFERLRTAVEDKDNAWVLAPCVIRKDLEAAGTSLSGAAKEAFDPSRWIDDGNFPSLLVP